MAKAITTRINAALAKAGREERFWRSPKGYYYVSPNDTRECGLYVFSLDPASLRDLQTAVEYVQMILDGNGNTEGLKLAEVVR